MKKRNCILAGIAALMILTATVPSALAYFTTYVTAKGMKEVVLGERTEIEEPGFSNWTKQIVITADNPSEPVYVRAQAYAPEGIVLIYESEGDKWSQPDSDGWCYYSDPISNGQSAAQLNVKIRARNAAGELIDPEVKEGDILNVVVVYEYTPVLYKEDNGELVPYMEWNKSITYSGTATSEASQTTPSDGSETGTETGGDNG